MKILMIMMSELIQAMVEAAAGRAGGGCLVGEGGETGHVLSWDLAVVRAAVTVGEQSSVVLAVGCVR